VSVDPSVDGLTVSGFGTMVEVGPKGVAMAGGWLSPTEHALKAVGTYPLRTAHDAFVGLGLLPVPEIACMVGKPCPWTDPVTITGATYGLMAAWEDGTRPLLVPAWDFTVAAGGTPVVQGALDPKYVVNGRSPGGPGTSGSGSASTGPGVSVGPAGSSVPGSSGSGGSSVHPGATTSPAPGGPYGITSVAPVPVPSPPVSPQSGTAG
jgi:hypothetical protein